MEEKSQEADVAGMAHQNLGKNSFACDKFALIFPFYLPCHPGLGQYQYIKSMTTVAVGEFRDVVKPSSNGGLLENRAEGVQ